MDHRGGDRRLGSTLTFFPLIVQHGWVHSAQSQERFKGDTRLSGQRGPWVATVWAGRLTNRSTLALLPWKLRRRGNKRSVSCSWSDGGGGGGHSRGTERSFELDRNGEGGRTRPIRTQDNCLASLRQKIPVGTLNPNNNQTDSW